MELDTRYAKAWIYLCGLDYVLLALIELFRFLGNDMNGLAPALAIRNRIGTVSVRRPFGRERKRERQRFPSN